MSTAQARELVLEGCTPVPLASYLKALGAFRLLAEQTDQEVKAFWRGEQFVLLTRLTREEFHQFFLEQYRPTPILSPWNGRAGYLEGDDADDSTRRGAVLLRIFRESKAERLKPYRTLIDVLDELAPLKEMNDVRALKKTLEREKKGNLGAWTDEKQNRLGSAIKREVFLKEQQLNLLRNALPDEQLAWIDSAVAINSEERAYAPLLGGSGGVEGSMDLGVNFMDNLLLLFASDNETGCSTTDSPEWLEHAFEGTFSRLIAKNTAGSLSPGRVGGPNATSGFSQYLNINPWDFVLMIEGAVAFKPSLVRKLESIDRARLSYPFTVRPSSIGAGAIANRDDEKTRSGSSEIWMPLWRKPAKAVEITTLLREGNVRLGAKAPKDGLDMARCVAKLGIDRGIDSFQRYLFLKRSGDNDLAIPLSRIDVSRTKVQNADLIADLDRGYFLQRLRAEAHEKDAPAGLRRAVSQLENALFALTRPGGGRQVIQRALILLGEVTQALSNSRKAQGPKAVPMLPRLSASWVLQSDDGSAEFRIALALASLLNLPAYLAPVERDKGNWQWALDSRLFVWGKGDLTRNLSRVIERRVIEAQRQQNVGLAPFDSHTRRLGARLSDIQTFLSDPAGDRRIAALLHGLTWVDLPDEMPSSFAEDAEGCGSVPISYVVLKPFFSPPDLVKYLGGLPEDACLTLPSELPRLLIAGHVQKCQSMAWQRARIVGLGWPQGDAPKTMALNGQRLLAALAVPIQSTALARLLPRAKGHH